MSNSRNSTPKSPEGESGISIWLVLGLIGVAVAILLAVQRQRPKSAGPYVGRPLPPLHAAGWLNTDQPVATEDLAGKVVLVDYWDTGCGPCVQGIPDVVAFRKRFRESGVVVIGLTSESGPAVEYVKNFVETKEGMDWPIGYGARLTFQMMDVNAIPTYMLYDRTGTCVWGGHSLDGAEEAAIKALAAKP